MRKLCLLLFLSLPLTNGAQAANEFPTDEVVRYVVGCMSGLGLQSEETLYTCVCRVDTIREYMSYEEYDGGNIMERYKKMPGKKGGFFRDNEEGHKLYDKLIETREKALAQCPRVIRIQAEFKDEEE